LALLKYHTSIYVQEVGKSKVLLNT